MEEVAVVFIEVPISVYFFAKYGILFTPCAMDDLVYQVYSIYLVFSDVIHIPLYGTSHMLQPAGRNW